MAKLGKIDCGELGEIGPRLMLALVIAADNRLSVGNRAFDAWISKRWLDKRGSNLIPAGNELLEKFIKRAIRVWEARYGRAADRMIRNAKMPALQKQNRNTNRESSARKKFRRRRRVH